MKAKERLFITANRDRVVAEGDPSGAFLYAAPGDEIPQSAAEMFGIEDGMAPGEKRRKGGEDKRRKDGSDKGGKGGGDKDDRESETNGGAGDEAGPAGDDLTQIKGIGKATAGRLAEAGIATFADLAAFEVSDPRFASLGVKAADLDGWIAQAAGMAKPAGGLTVEKLPKGD